MIMVYSCISCAGNVQKEVNSAMKKGYIPQTLGDCFVILSSVISSDDIEKIQKNQITEEQFTLDNHMGLGMWIRNNWIRSGKFPLAAEWNQLGAKSMDDISDIILTSYYRHTAGQDIRLEEQLSYYKEYWNAHTFPIRDNYPEGVKILTELSAFHYDIDEDLRMGCLHVAKDTINNKIWLYDYYYGWKNVNKEQLSYIESEAPLTMKVIEKIFNE